MLTRHDESLVHQAPLTFAHAVTSDHRFYDRVYVEAADPAGGAAVCFGLGVYKNTNTLDGFLSVQCAGKQHNLRVSRPLSEGPDEMAAGPLAYEVTEPLRAVRVSLGANESGLAADLRFTGLVDPIEEADHFARVDGRVQEDVHRYNQVGRAEGHVEVDGERVGIDGWWATRDHSWGVRAGVGGFEPKTAALPHQLVSGFLYTWAAFSTDDVVGYLQVHENGAGERSTFDGVLRPRDGGPDRRVTAVEWEYDRAEGSRLYDRCRATVTTDDGVAHELAAERLLPPWVMRGTGYDNGYADRRGLGVFRGPVLEHDVYDLSGPTEVRVLPDGEPLPHFHREHLVRLTFDGAPGTGHVTALMIGALPKYGVPPFTSEELMGLMKISQGG